MSACWSQEKKNLIYVAWKAHAISSTYLLAPRVRWLRVEGFIVPPLPSRHKTPGHQVAPAQLHLEHQRLLVLEEGKAARRAMAQFLLQPLPCGDCDGKRAGGWRGGEGSFYWGARVLGCCQPKSCHLSKVRSERFYLNEFPTFLTGSSAPPTGSAIV